MSPSRGDASSSANDKPYPHWHDVGAGAAAGLGARGLTAPLDLLKIRRQLQPDSIPSTPGKRTASSRTVVHATTLFAGGEWQIWQHLQSIAEKEGGVRSLYRGNVAASYLWMGYSVAQFWMYGYASQYLHSVVDMPDQNDVKISGAIGFASGAAAGLCATVVTYPFDFCRTIFAARGIFPVAAANVTWSDRTTDLASTNRQQYLQRHPPKTLREFARHMYQQKGFQGFYSGAAPGLLQIVPYMGINFALHDALMALSGSHGSGMSGLAGMGAGVISKLLVYPLDTVKKRLQAQAFWGSNPADDGRKSTKYSTALPKSRSMYSNRKKVVGAVNRGIAKKPGDPVVYEGMLDCFRQIARREGIAAFYKGLVPSLLKSSVSTGASFWLFTLTKNALQSIHDSGRS